jgi:Ca-activated chloride channel homolog
MKFFCARLVLVVFGLACLAPLVRQSQLSQAQQADTAVQQAQGVQSGAPVATQQAPGQPPASISDPVRFVPKDGTLTGWKMTIPSGRQLATPAVAGGKVFVGGGFGSHEFYALDAATGRKLWQYQTHDDGPTAAVVSDGYVGFNTESCELEILTVSGKTVWKKWLGDPLMSMPAIDRGKVYMVYPDSKGDHQHYLACFELKTGKEFWKKTLIGEIITAPVVAAEHVYVAALEGTLYCFGQHDGELLWKQKANATSSPVVWQHRCYFSRRQEISQKKGDKILKQQTEQLAQRGIGVKDDTSNFVATSQSADYLDVQKRIASPVEAANQTTDGQVGFGNAGLGGLGFGGGGLGGIGAMKGDAKMAQAMANVGQASVVGVWSYQGSKPFLHQGRLYNTMGDTLRCVDPQGEKVLWKKTFHSENTKDKKPGGQPLLDSVLTPPSIVNDKIFLGTSRGELICASVKNGETLWKATVGEPIVFQPVIAKGRVYASTSKGSLICLETGDAKDDGWLMWGATAAHNGLAK